MKPGKAILIYATVLLVASGAHAPWIAFVVHWSGDWQLRSLFNRIILCR
jgi:hypothetical protein